MTLVNMLRAGMFIMTTVFVGAVGAQNFEGVGEISEVRLGENLIEVNEQLYSLPMSTLLDGRAAIVQLQPGYQIGFSGAVGSPYSVIKSVYLYPESVLRVRRGENAIGGEQP